MRRYSILIFGLLTILFPVSAMAQATTVLQPINQERIMANELFRNESMGAARIQFNLIADNKNYSSSEKEEAALFAALCGARLQNADAITTLRNFINTHSESAALNAAFFELGRLQFNDNSYSEALISLEQVEISSLNNEQLAEYYFKTGYCQFKTKKIDLAESAFFQVKKGTSQWAMPSTYYYSHIAYTKGKYQEAENGFNILKDIPLYHTLAPFYLAQIYYQQGRYDELLKLSVPILSDNNGKPSVEMIRLTGNALFNKGQYAEAVPLLERFAEANPSALTRNDYYQMGYACYKIASYEKGIKWFQEVIREQDSLSQNAWYHLADCYLKTNQKKFAGEAFLTTSKMSFNKELAEEALFNYARLSIETNFSPYNEAIKAIRAYIAANPTSKRIDEANSLLAQLLLITKNYKTALDIIESVKNKDEQLKTAYQKIAYYRGVELYNDRDYKAAIAHFTKSLQYPNDRTVSLQCLYLTAEAFYQLNNWDKASDYYEQFGKAKGASLIPGYLYINYNLGYCLFKQKQYSQANVYFKRFVADTRIKDNRSLSDAYIRSADCSLMAKNFNEAIRSYDEALQLRAASPEYVYLQKAMAMGAKGDLKQKIQSLQQIIDKYPQSPYSDQARYEIGNAYLLEKNDSKALESFNEVITRFPKSPMAAKSMLKSGLIHYNNDQNDQAIENLKMLISKYPNTQESREALSTLKNIYVDLNRVDDFVAYSSKFQQGNISTTEQDSLLYVAAESQYLKGNCEEAIRGFSSYLRQFPEGSFAAKASWYKADCESKSGDSKSALEDYERIISLPSSANYDKALAAAAAITFQQKQYTKALDYYTKLEGVTSDKTLRNDAYIGQMRCNYKLNNYGLAAQAAQRLGNSAENSTALVAESNLIIGVSALKLNNLPLAKRSLEKIITDQGAIGAEANYYLALLNFQQQKNKEAEKIILNLQNNYASHDYWVAKGFVLLSDVYVQLGNAFQAKVTLQSVLENYKGDDDIIPAAKEKLSQLDSSKTITK